MNDTLPGDAAILTPDQRLRVFVSSTLAELADERRSVSRAITGLRFTPVMFEAGARPHQPRDLYRAYLAQSDIFIGVYWQRYGQAAEGSQRSGLEEEWELSGTLPRLVYEKLPAPDRDPRLTELLSRIKPEASVRRFHTAAELGRLVRDDLAALLSERFAASPAASSTREPSTGPRRVPMPTTPLIGRESAIEEVGDLLRRPDVRLVTLTGPGRVGKTRLALAMAERLRETFVSGALWVPLADVPRAELVLPNIARAAGPDLAETDSPLEALVNYFSDGRWLIVLDNLEQVIDAGREIDALLARAPGATVLATSVTVLRLRTEREYPVLPLPPPPDPDPTALDELQSSPAVALFVERAQAVRHDFEVTAANAAAVAEICRRLEGLPLAIELAAARTRVLDPEALLSRLARSLDALGTGAADLPERQQTLRATVEWSVGMLHEDVRSLLEIMAVFVDGCKVAAVADVAAIDEDRALELTESLVRHSLIYVDDRDRGTRFRMLATIRGFMAERLAGRPDASDVAQRHARHYRALIARAERELRGFGQRESFARLQTESGNVAAMTRWYLKSVDPGELASLLLIMSPFAIMWPWWGYRSDARFALRALLDRLMPIAPSLEPRARAELLLVATLSALDASDDAAALATGRDLAPLLDLVDDPYVTALCELTMGWVAILDRDLDRALDQASRSLQSFRALGEPLWLAVALSTVSGVETFHGRYEDALRDLTELRDLTAQFDNSALSAIHRASLGTLAIARGELDNAPAIFDEGMELAITAHNTHAFAMCLVAFARLRLAQADPHRAALLMGASDGLRRRAGVDMWTSLRGEGLLNNEIRETLGSGPFEEMFARGSELTQSEALAATRD